MRPRGEGHKMKVFLSWSGKKSHRIAIIFRDWLPSVIQEINPYVSSEDIDKGARWSTDIANELSDSTFGILCVTRENINAPWLTFEAGALSKTMAKSFVSPFLFDIKRSEVDGPILQFQSTISEKADLKKLVTTLNKACEKDSLSDDRLNKAFEVWYPTLKGELDKIHDDDIEEDGDIEGELHTPKTQEILEEVLELSRINQKLIRNPNSSLNSNIEDLSEKIQMLIHYSERARGSTDNYRPPEIHAGRLMELIQVTLNENANNLIGAQMTLGLVRSQLPWLYDAGIETLHILRSKISKGEKHLAVIQFKHIMDFAFENQVVHRMSSESNEMHYMRRHIPELLANAFQHFLHE